MGLVQIIDVTLRDGGKAISHRWTAEQARTVVGACATAGVRYVEVGYWRPRRHQVDGSVAPAASCPASYLGLLRRSGAGASLVVMTSAADCEPGQLAELSGQGVRMLRMPFRPAGVAAVRPFAQAAHDAGLEIGINLADVSRLSRDAVLRFAERVTGDGADALWLADSYGSMFPEQVASLAAALREVTGIALGLHPHDSLSLAFANSLTAVRAGFGYVDASLSGIGTDGGNLATELITGYLRAHGQAGLMITPLVDAAAGLLVPWPGADLRTRWSSMANAALDSAAHDPALWREREPGQILALFDQFPVAS
jgi:4-hydroxy 2-oxovalerate aldolase